MGLGQVRDLRKASIQTIIDQREIQPFKNLGDLSERVSLQTKEIDHLIQCGALDGLGRSRAAMLAKAQSVKQAGSTRQISFDFGVVQAPGETPAERLDWEQLLLGLPVTVHPLDIIEEMPSGTTPISVLTETDSDKLAGQRLSVVGVRLPGWTGGPGFFLANRDDFITVNDEAIDKDGFKPEPWQPVEVRGRWRQDPWGTSWLQADKFLQLK
jgi:DNA polymerase III alpha subunit